MLEYIGLILQAIPVGRHGDRAILVEREVKEEIGFFGDQEKAEEYVKLVCDSEWL